MIQWSDQPVTFRINKLIIKNITIKLPHLLTVRKICVKIVHYRLFLKQL